MHVNKALAAFVVVASILSVAQAASPEECAPDGTEVADAMRITVIVISFGQFLWLIFMYPRVGWESCLVPFLEGFSYLLSLVTESKGNIGLATGYNIQWIRYAGWLVTVPVLLLQICALDPSENAKRNTNFMVAANQLMLVLGISSSLFDSQEATWALFIFGTVFGLVVYYVVFSVLKRFIFEGGHGREANRYARYIGLIFYPSWTMFPVLQLIGNENLCLISDDVNVSLHVLADILSKNIFGILFWHLKWNLMQGTNQKRAKGGLFAWLSSKDNEDNGSSEPSMSKSSLSHFETKLTRIACVSQRKGFPDQILSAFKEAGCKVDKICGPGVQTLLPLIVNDTQMYDILLADESLLSPFGTMSLSSGSGAEIRPDVGILQTLASGMDLTNTPNSRSALRESGVVRSGMIVVAVLDKPGTWNWEALRSHGVVDFIGAKMALNTHEVSQRIQRWKNVGTMRKANTMKSIDFGGNAYHVGPPTQFHQRPPAPMREPITPSQQVPIQGVVQQNSINASGAFLPNSQAAPQQQLQGSGPLPPTNESPLGPDEGAYRRSLAPNNMNSTQDSINQSRGFIQSMFA